MLLDSHRAMIHYLLDQKSVRSRDCTLSLRFTEEVHTHSVSSSYSIIYLATTKKSYILYDATTTETKSSISFVEEA